MSHPHTVELVSVGPQDVYRQLTSSASGSNVSKSSSPMHVGRPSRGYQLSIARTLSSHEPIYVELYLEFKG